MAEPPRNRKQRDTAVALGYDPSHSATPTVLASGRGTLARDILDLAFAHGVKVREDADLAEMLGMLEVGEQIPVDAFAAVAEVLAYVYRANGEAPPRFAFGRDGTGGGERT